MKILALSDTHLEFPRVADLPEADVLVHAGDWTDVGFRHNGFEIRSFEQFLRDLREKYPTVLALHGNHDLGFDNGRWRDWDVTPIDSLTWTHPNGIRFHGVALTPAFHLPELLLEFKHMTIDQDEEDAAWDFEPVDVVVSHGPPFGYLDMTTRGKNVGSRAAASYIRRHQPRVFVCGHVHEAAGEAQLRDTQIINVAGTFEVIDLEPVAQSEPRDLLPQLRSAYAEIKRERVGLFERLAHQGKNP
jgi:uncharacterized protein